MTKLVLCRPRFLSFGTTVASFSFLIIFCSCNDHATDNLPTDDHEYVIDMIRQTARKHGVIVSFKAYIAFKSTSHRERLQAEGVTVVECGSKLCKKNASDHALMGKCFAP
jgi:hypothetical protein